MELEDLVRSALSADRDSNESMTLDEQSAILRSGFDAFTNPQQFKPGDIVKWRPNMNNRSYPRKNSIGVFVRYIDPVVASEDKASAYGSEELDCIIGAVDHDEEVFLLFHMTSSRFELA